MDRIGNTQVLWHQGGNVGRSYLVLSCIIDGESRRFVNSCPNKLIACLAKFHLDAEVEQGIFDEILKVYYGN